MSGEERVLHPCPGCAHAPTWHHEERGCMYHGTGETRCPCRLSADEVVTALLAAIGRERFDQGIRRVVPSATTDAATDQGGAP